MSGIRDPKHEHVLSINNPTLEDDKDDSPCKGRKREETKKLVAGDYKKMWNIRRDSMNIREPSCQRKVLLMLSVLTVSLDPLFFYIPMINMDAKCLRSDKLLGIMAIIFRTLVDALHAVLWMHYHEGFCCRKRENSRPFFEESPLMSIKLARVVAFLSLLPLPQAVTILILSMKGSTSAPHAVTLLKFTVLCQFVLRALRIFPAFTEATRNSYSMLMSRVWVGAGFNLILFMISSHVVGAFWYLLAVGRTMDCWKSACERHPGCRVASLYCTGLTDEMGKKGFLNDQCPMESKEGKQPFDFGIYLPALQTNIIGSTKFILKISYCFWWGLRNLSSLGQNLTTSAHEWEICFSICISVLGLILFSLFIGNMQTYFQSKTQRNLEKMRDKLNEKTEKIISKQQQLLAWVPLRVISSELREQIESCRTDKWIESKDINLKSILESLPKKLSKKLKTELCKKVLPETLSNGRTVEVLCDIARPTTFPENSRILNPGNPIHETILIVSGKIDVTNENGSKIQLSRGDSVGEQLEQVLSNSSVLANTSSAATVMTVTEVEAFVIRLNDLKYFRRYGAFSVKKEFFLFPRRNATSSTLKWPKYFCRRSTSV